MAGAVWILLRSLWTHLRVCADLHHTTPLFWTAHTLGWGLPALFLAISLPITGVSYQVGKTCFPNQRSAFITWFGWLLAFACLAALLQFITTGFCLWLYLRHFLHLSNSSIGDSADSSSRPETALVTLNTSSPSRKTSIPPASHRTGTTPPYLSKRFAYRRVRSLLLLQWRSIALSLFVITSTIYFGVVFAATTRAAHADSTPSKTAAIEIWAACLVVNNGEKGECLKYARGFVLGEGVVLATFYMSALIGVVTFALMVRRDMVVGWWELLSGAEIHWARRRGRGGELRDEGGGSGGDGKMVQMTDEAGMAEVPEAGDVGTRHATTDLFDGDDDNLEGDEEVQRTERTRARGGKATSNPPSGGGGGGIEAGDVGTRHETTDFFAAVHGYDDEIDEEAQRPKRTRLRDEIQRHLVTLS
ncbi:hypothetical protein LTR75_005909 [Friedmanniomyces endolithicus]|nr:hypothetical protein LTR75_005909 [Friedmanniomyces endolithicus]